MTPDPDFPEVWRLGQRAAHMHRPGFAELVGTFALHPVIVNLVHKQMIRPVDWHQLLLEWPHISQDDETLIAYCRNEAALTHFVETSSSTRQTKTSIGKYLARHWPHVADHKRRDVAGTFSPEHYEIWEGVERLITAVELGPKTCMKSTSQSIPFNTRHNRELQDYLRDPAANLPPPWHKHPYSVYTPEHGWAIAVRLDRAKPNEVLGRCLLHKPSETYVRSFKRGDCESAYSYSDEKLEHWLETQGYTKEGGWTGCTFAKVDHPCGGYMAPYIDGNDVYAANVVEHFEITDNSDGNLKCENTDGTMSAEEEDDEEDTIGTCEDCDETVYDGSSDHIYVGRDRDTLICRHCAQDYSYVTGAGHHGRHNEYYVHDDNVLTVGDEAYDEENLPDYIVQLHNDDWVNTNDTEYVETVDNEWYPEDECVQTSDVDGDDTGDWYPADDERIVYCADSCYRLKDDCVQVGNHTGDWHHADSDEIVQPEDEPDEWHLKDDCWEAPNGDFFTEEQAQEEMFEEEESSC